MTDASTTPTLSAAPLEPVVAAVAVNQHVAAWTAAVRSDAEGGAHARISEPALPLLLAAAHAGAPGADGRLEPVNARPLLVVAATDADAERIAEAVGWYIGTENAAPYISRAVRYGSGVAPAPARVGARENARRVARMHGVVVASVASLIERVPQASHRPEPVEVGVGDTIDRDDLER